MKFSIISVHSEGLKVRAFFIDAKMYLRYKYINCGCEYMLNARSNEKKANVYDVTDIVVLDLSTAFLVWYWGFWQQCFFFGVLLVYYQLFTSYIVTMEGI